MKEEEKKGMVYLGLARITVGLVFLWAFFDKLFGLGYATKVSQSWLNGGSPAGGFLAHGVHGPLASLYQGLAGNPIVDTLFMLGLLGIGLALVLGIGLKIAGYCGALLVLLMWSAALPPQNNPLVDEHVIYFFLLLSFAHSNVGEYVGFGKQWAQSDLVKSNPFLK